MFAPQWPSGNELAEVTLQPTVTAGRALQLYHVRHSIIGEICSAKGTIAKVFALGLEAAAWAALLTMLAKALERLVG